MNAGADAVVAVGAESSISAAISAAWASSAPAGAPSSQSAVMSKIGPIGFIRLQVERLADQLFAAGVMLAGGQRRKRLAAGVKHVGGMEWVIHPLARR